jgi:IS5 family transposase
MCGTEAMKQISLGKTGFERKRTRKREFLDEMNLVVPWSELVSLVAPYAPTRSAKGGRPPFAVETMLRIHPADAAHGVWLR